MKINPVRFAVALGLVLAVFHAGWALMVAMGWAQPMIDFIFWAHFITPPFHVEVFQPGRAAILIGFTFLAGLLLGFAGGHLWNKLAGATG